MKRTTVPDLDLYMTDLLSLKKTLLSQVSFNTLIFLSGHVTAVPFYNGNKKVLCTHAQNQMKISMFYVTATTGRQQKRKLPELFPVKIHYFANKMRNLLLCIFYEL